MIVAQLFAELNVDTNSDSEKWAAVKIIRNQLLKDCDWTQLPDAVMSIEEKTAWQEYRQALRDLPQAFNSPDDVMFPSQPEVSNG